MESIPYELIAKYLFGECTKAESLSLDAWRESSQENEKTFQDLAKTFAVSGVKPGEMNEVKAETLRMINSQRLSGTPKTKLNKWFFAFCGAAAAAVILGIFFISSRPKAGVGAQEVVVSTLPGQKSQISLPDGTKIWLNSGTTIAYASDYNLHNRKVCLREGEAYFEVAKSEKNQFLLDANGLGVRVWGTKFDVSRYSNDSEFSIVLQSGHIDVLDASMATVLGMLPGQKYTLDVESGSSDLSTCDVSDDGLWRFGELRISRENLTQVVSKMEKWYGVNIVLQGKRSDNLYWMSIKTESLREMLDLINKIHPIRYTIKGSNVTITE
jgi:transmembrane sensor